MEHQRFFRSALDSGFFSKNSSFRLFGSKSTEDERLALMERFRHEGLDGKKLNDAQMLPFVWQWLADAEINCKSLRHQIDKMRKQHDEELQEVGDYVEQVWKLSTEKLIFLEAENANLKEHQTCHHRHGDAIIGDDDDDDDEMENSETESKHHYLEHFQRRKQALRLPQIRSYRRPIVTSVSTSSLSSSFSGLINEASIKLNNTENIHKIQELNSKDEFCEKCEILDTELLENRSKILELENTVEELSEKCFVLEKLNRNIELENENFAYKLAEAENRSNNLERKIINLEKEQTRLSSTSKVNEHNARILVQELNQKIKNLEEEMDLRAQVFEELEVKYHKQKERHQEALWKLRNFIHDKENSDNSAELFASETSNDSDSGHKSSKSGISQTNFHSLHPSSSSNYHHCSIDKLV